MTVNLDGPVAIIGAEIGGLTAALSFWHFGVPVRVFEQARALREIGAGVTFTPNAMSALDFLGTGRLGVDVVALGEHHRPEYYISTPETVLAGIATRASRIRLASGVTVLSSDDPVRELVAA